MARATITQLLMVLGNSPIMHHSGGGFACHLAGFIAK
jgi:hypothetical protein